MKIIITPYRQYLNFNGLMYLTPQRLHRFCKYRRDEDKARCLAAGLLIRLYAGLACEPVYGAHGKPYAHGTLYFNISHGGEYVILALNKDEIGIDTEGYTDFCTEIANICFTTLERTWLFGAQNIKHAFFKLWTLKESVMKLFGYGLNMSPDSFELWPPDSHRHIVRKRDIYLFSYEFDGHVLGAACFEPYTTPEIIFVDAENVLYEIENTSKI